MGTIVATPRQVTYPQVVVHPAIEVKSRWSHAWSVDPDLELVSMRACAAGQDLGECTLRRRYGYLKHPHESSLAAHAPQNLDGYWVRLRSANGETGDYDTLWTGIFAGERRQLFGTNTDSGVFVPAGDQEYAAYEPAYLLRRMYVSSSDWLATYNGSETVQRIQWLPDLNGRDKGHTLIGNRTGSKYTGDGHDCYLFGGSAVWTRRQFIEYILDRFANVAGQPVWTLGGTAVSVLGDVEDTLRLGSVHSVYDLVRMMVPTRLGVDFAIVPTDDGFEISVYSLSPTAISYGGATLPANPDTVIWQVRDALDLASTEVARSQSQRYATIRVLGRRMVVCCSPRVVYETLEPKWTTIEESDYLDGTGTPADEDTLHDQARRRDEMRRVWQQYAIPVDMDPDDLLAAPLVAADGTVDPNDTGPRQNVVRRTLRWLPLREGKDYSAGVPADEGAGELLAPVAYVQDPETLRYVPVDTLGISVSVLSQDWGVHLGASPNHLLALNHWDGAADSADEPQYDYDTLVTTIAFEADQRLRLEETLDDDDGSVLEIIDDSAELWYLAQNTVVGIDAGGVLQATASGAVIRNDVDKLGQIMAGAVARYQQSRARAVFVLEGWHHLQGYIGHVLVGVDDGGGSEEMAAPITSVRWDADPPRTVLITGFAGGA